MMTREKGAFNPLQAVCALAALLFFLLLPIVSFGMFGINVLHLNGWWLLGAGMMPYLIPLLLLVVMLACSFGPLQNGSLIVAAVALVAEGVMAALAANILLGNNQLTKLMAIIPPEYLESLNSYGPMVTTVLTSVIQVGLGMILAMVATVLYGAFHFVNLQRMMGGGGNGKTAYSRGNAGKGNSGTAYSNRSDIKL